MGYLSSYRGDYLASYRGDPGFFGWLGKGIGSVAKRVIGATPIGIAATTAVQILKGSPRGVRPQRGRGIRYRRQMGLPPMPTGGPAGMGGSVSPGAQGPLMAPLANGRRRRMNPANPKALRRAIRRQTSFIRLARRALKGSGYTITARGSRRRPSPRIQEFGPGSVTVAR